MKITQIDIMTPRIQENPMWRPILCRIHTDEGIYGDGEAGIAYGTGYTAAGLRYRFPGRGGYDS